MGKLIGIQGDKGAQGEKGDHGERREPFSMKWVVKISLIILTSIVVIGWADVFYWKYYPFVPAVIHGKIKVLNPSKEVCAGTDMLYEVDITKYMNVPCVVKRQLVNSSLIMYDPSSPPRKPLGRQQVKSGIFVPKRADSAEWYMRFTVEYMIGPDGDRVVPVSSESEKFRVIDCSDHQGKQGVPGKQGIQGKKGKQGETGPRGGISLFGKGDKGDKGNKGNPGKDGKDKK